MAMALKQEELQVIGKYVQNHLQEWLPDQRYSFELLERMVRVEEELKSQRELMKQGFEQIDKRFEQDSKQFIQIGKQFEQIGRQIEAIQTKMFHFRIWSFGFIVTVAGVAVGILKLT